MNRCWQSSGLLALLALLAAGCVPAADAPPLVRPAAFVPSGAIAVPARQLWTDTGYDAVAGEPLTIAATGLVEVPASAGSRLDQATLGQDVSIGPEGTYLYGDRLHDRPFPLPAAGRGPAPCFCLIGRIGQGRPFFVGKARSWTPDETGRLFLGINDFDPSGNSGEFYAEIDRPQQVQPMSFRTDVPLDAAEGLPSVCGRVVVIYVDGLRPDVLEEMAAMGHVPNLRRQFIDGGACLRNTFTVFPSDTITANGTMWTGCFSDRHGLKGQVRFSRRRRTSESFLEPLGPSRSARQLDPQGIDQGLIDAKAAAMTLLAGDRAAERYRQSASSQTPALFTWLRAQGEDWATGVLPVMTEVAPPLWTRSMARCLPYFDAQEAWKYIDDANANYAVRHLLRDRQPVTVVWMPETDTVSHKECRGQFGSTRRTIARADRLVGEILAELEAQHRLEDTFLILVSDHGHHGGQSGFLRRYDLTHELLFDPRQVNPQRKWVGGGLGLSVRQHRFANLHAGDSEDEFVFVDGDSDGTARLFLPRTHFRSHDWSSACRPSDLLAYRISPEHPSINLPVTIAQATRSDADGQAQHPVDLVLTRAGPEAILITTRDRGQAVIERKRSTEGPWVYRYTPVAEVAPTNSGWLAYRAARNPRTDPLELAERAGAGFLENFHDETVWLWVTAGTEYPDSVVALTRHMLWQEHLGEQEREYAADIVVTARAGWMFGRENTPGTTHGYPLAESMRAAWYVSGPGIRRGARIEAPCRLTDLTPTILELTGTPFDPHEMDGRPLRTIYADAQGPRSRPSPPSSGEKLANRPDEGEVKIANDSGALESQMATRRELHAGSRSPSQQIEQASLTTDASEKAHYWSQVDLYAWHADEYTPDPPYPNLPRSINQPSNGWDLNNIAYNAMTIGDWSVLRLADDAIAAATPGRGRLAVKLGQIETKARHSDRPWLAEGADVLNVAELSLKDYSLTSSGNLRRADRLVDWLQDRQTMLDRALARPWGRMSVLGTRHTNRMVDGVQQSFRNLYRFGQRVIAQTLDEAVLNGVENTIDEALNARRRTPAEVLVPGTGR